MLTVRASRPTRTSEGVEFLVAELPTGEFSRQLVLGNALDMSGIAATFDAGVLTVTIPEAETAKPGRRGRDLRSQLDHGYVPPDPAAPYDE